MRPRPPVTRNCVQRSSMACPKMALILRAATCHLFRTRAWAEFPDPARQGIPSIHHSTIDENVTTAQLGYIDRARPSTKQAGRGGGVRTWAMRIIWRLRPGRAQRGRVIDCDHEQTPLAEDARDFGPDFHGSHRASVDGWSHHMARRAAALWNLELA